MKFQVSCSGYKKRY